MKTIKVEILNPCFYDVDSNRSTSWSKYIRKLEKATLSRFILQEDSCRFVDLNKGLDSFHTYKI